MTNIQQLSLLQTDLSAFNKWLSRGDISDDDDDDDDGGGGGGGVCAHARANMCGVVCNKLNQVAGTRNYRKHTIKE
jgi:hypothetical protein